MVYGTIGPGFESLRVRTQTLSSKLGVFDSVHLMIMTISEFSLVGSTIIQNQAITIDCPISALGTPTVYVCEVRCMQAERGAARLHGVLLLERFV